MKATARAKRLAHFLETELGYNIADDYERCWCGVYPFNKFCANCGAKAKPQSRKQAYSDLENALIYTLKEQSK